MRGTIRLVNPYRGSVAAGLSKLHRGGVVLCATRPTEEVFEIRAVVSGVEYWTGRTYSREEIERIASGEESLSVEFWYGFPIGERRLAEERHPGPEEVRKTCKESLAAEKQSLLKPLDNFELWICEKTVPHRPLFLAISGFDLEEISSITFSPMLRLTSPGHLVSEFPGAVDFLERVNGALVNTGTLPRFGFFSRIFFRNPNGSCLEYFSDETTADHPPGVLPDGIFSTDLEQELRKIEASALAANPNLPRLLPPTQDEDAVLNAILSAFVLTGWSYYRLSKKTKGADPSGEGVSEDSIAAYFTRRKRLTTEKAQWLLSVLNIELRPKEGG